MNKRGANRVYFATLALMVAGCGGNAQIDRTETETGSSTEPPLPTCEAAGGTLTVLASEQRRPGGVAVDEQFAYWANLIEEGPTASEDGTIVRAPLGGGEVTELAKDPTRPAKVALDGANVYWTGVGGRIGKTPKEGGGSVVLYEGEQLVDIAIDEEHVYAADPLPGQGAIVRVELLTGQAETLAEGGGWASFNLALDESNVYWCNAIDERIWTASKDAPVKQVFFEPVGSVECYQSAINQVAVDEQNVYWVFAKYCGSSEGSILFMPKEGGEPVTLVPSLTVSGVGLVVGESFVYWTEPKTGRVMKVPKAGGEPVAIACEHERPVGLTIDDAFVYWSNFDGGTVMKAPK